MSVRKSLIIIGGGGFAREVIWLVKNCSDEWQIEGILDDNSALQGQIFCEIPVIGVVNDCSKYPYAYFIVAVGTTRTRKSIVSRMLSIGEVRYATLIHPSVMMSKYVEIGEGSILTAGVILTTNITLGKHNIVNLACTIGHDVMTGDFCTFAPQASVSGNVNIGSGVELGTGAIVIQGVEIATGSFIGAGSIVSKDISENVFAAGSPARQIKSMEKF